MNILHSIMPWTLDKCESEVNGSRIEDREEEPSPRLIMRLCKQKLLFPFKHPPFPCPSHITSHPPKHITTAVHLLLSLEVVEEDGAFLGLLTPVLDDNTRAVDNLASVTLTVKLAYSQTSLAQSRLLTAKWNSVYIQRPTHSPSIFPSGTLMRGILCSEHRAMTSFL